MSIFGEFRAPTDALALADTFDAEPETIIEIDRVVAAEEQNGDQLTYPNALAGR